MKKRQRFVWLVKTIAVAAVAVSFSLSCVKASGTVASGMANVPAPNSIAPDAVGIATLRRGPIGMVVFDAALHVDLLELASQPGFTKAKVIALPQATVLLIPIKPDQIIDVASNIASWSIAIKQRPRFFQAGAPLVGPTSLLFPLSSASSSVTVSDPVSGQPLLIGTLTGAGSLRAGLHGVGYAVLPTWRGVAVQALSDELQLKPESTGFRLVNTDGLDSSAFPKESARQNEPASLTKSVLGLPSGSIKDLRNQLLNAQMMLAVAPPLDRLPASLQLARVFLALDMGPEARGILENALRDDPASSGNVLRQRLLAVAGVLDERPQELLALNKANIGHSTEMQLWRGVALAEQEDIKPAAKLLAESFLICLSYPKPIVDYLAPLVAETLVAGNQLASAKSFLHALPHQTGLALAKAELLEAAHHQAAALAAYHSLRQSADMRASGIAAGRIILMRQAMHQISARQAATELSRDLYFWRGPRNELLVRLSLARLRQKAGEWAEALHGLKTAVTALPKDAKQFQHERSKVFTAMITSGAVNKLNPIEAVSAIQENEDLIPAGADGAPILNVLAHRLLALDLPGAAAPVLEDIAHRAEARPDQARLELSLARVDLQSDNLQGAEAALAQADLEDQSADMITQRNLLLAEVKARGGNMASALNSISAAKDSSSMTLKSHLQLDAHDWKAAEVTLEERIDKLSPQPGALPAASANIIEQLATAASNAGDTRELLALREKYGDRLVEGPQKHIFDALTTPKIDPNVSLSKALKQISSIEGLRAAILEPPFERP